MLGFQGCDILGTGMVMYGQPHATYKALGDVTDDNGKPLSGIRVVINPNPTMEEPDFSKYYSDTAYTDAEGHYEKATLKYNWPDELKNATVKFEDVSGEYMTVELTSSQTSVTQVEKGSGAWDSGTFEMKADATMQKVPRDD